MDRYTAVPDTTYDRRGFITTSKPIPKDVDWINLGRVGCEDFGYATTEPDPALVDTGKRTLAEVYLGARARWMELFSIPRKQAKPDENPQYDTTARGFTCTD